MRHREYLFCVEYIRQGTHSELPIYASSLDDATRQAKEFGARAKVGIVSVERREYGMISGKVFLVGEITVE